MSAEARYESLVLFVLPLVSRCVFHEHRNHWQFTWKDANTHKDCQSNEMSFPLPNPSGCFLWFFLFKPQVTNKNVAYDRLQFYSIQASISNKSSFLVLWLYPFLAQKRNPRAQTRQDSLIVLLRLPERWARMYCCRFCSHGKASEHNDAKSPLEDQDVEQGTGEGNPRSTQGRALGLDQRGGGRL